MSYDRAARLPSVDRYPILNQAQARRTFFATFQRNCGADEVCQAQLVVRPRLQDRDGKELSRGGGGFAAGEGVYQLELGSLPDNQLLLAVELENLGEAAYEARLDIVHSREAALRDKRDPRAIIVYKEYQSVCPSFGIGSHHSLPSIECVPPLDQKWGGKLACG